MNQRAQPGCAIASRILAARQDPSAMFSVLGIYITYNTYNFDLKPLSSCAAVTTSASTADLSHQHDSARNRCVIAAPCPGASAIAGLHNCQHGKRAVSDTTSCPACSRSLLALHHSSPPGH